MRKLPFAIVVQLDVGTIRRSMGLASTPEMERRAKATTAMDFMTAGIVIGLENDGEEDEREVRK